MTHRIFSMPFARVYPLYITKLERKGRTQAELHEVISWLTGFDEAAIRRHIESESTFEEFFAQASIHQNADQITGVICGVKVQEIEDPLMRNIRYLDKLVDELYKGKPMQKVLRPDRITL